jgi:hypothetical protein
LKSFVCEKAYPRLTFRDTGPSRSTRVSGFTTARRIYGRFMDKDHAGELEGQTSINELLDEPVGATHMQLVLPIHVLLQSGEFRRLS